MNATWYTRKTCRLCDAPVELVLALKPSPLANNYTAEPVEQPLYPLDLMQCTACGHVQLGIVVDPKVLYSDYRYRSGVSATFTRHLGELALDVSMRKPRGFVVEIASNDGTLLKAFECLGHNTVGIDPSGTYNCVREFFCESTSVDYGRKADIVAAINVMAHVDDLRGFVRGVKKLLARDGIFVFEVQYLKDLIEGQRFDMIYHEHLDYHHFAPLKPFLEREGFRIEGVSFNESQGGSMRVRCTHAFDEGEIDVTALAIPANPVEGLSGVVAAYGACAKTTGLICQTGAKFDVLYDDTPGKLGFYAPTGQRIVTPAEARADHVYVAAWNFKREIMARHPELNYV